MPPDMRCNDLCQAWANDGKCDDGARDRYGVKEPNVDTELCAYGTE